MKGLVVALSRDKELLEGELKSLQQRILNKDVELERAKTLHGPVGSPSRVVFNNNENPYGMGAPVKTDGPAAELIEVRRTSAARDIACLGKLVLRHEITRAEQEAKIWEAEASNCTAMAEIGREDTIATEYSAPPPPYQRSIQNYAALQSQESVEYLLDVLRTTAHRLQEAVVNVDTTSAHGMAFAECR